MVKNSWDPDSYTNSYMNSCMNSWLKSHSCTYSESALDINHLIFFVHHPDTFVHRSKNRFLCPPFSMFITLGANSCRLVILNAPIGVQGHGDKKNIIHSLSMQSRMFFGEEWTTTVDWKLTTRLVPAREQLGTCRPLRPGITVATWQDGQPAARAAGF